MKAIVLLSGGLDSAVTLYSAKKFGYQCFCLTFDYGQRHKKEIKAAKKIARIAKCPDKILKIKLPWKGSSLLDRKISLTRPGKNISAIPSTYVPARNTIFLSFALSYAEAVKAEAIFIGAHALDYSGYPDCRPEYFGAFQKLIFRGTKAGIEKKEIKIKVPLLNKNKSQIISLGKKLGVPFELTWSCYKGGKRPCGKCDSCIFRAKGFSQAGIEDPL